MKEQSLLEGQLIVQWPVLHGIGKFITVPTRAYHQFLLRAKWTALCIISFVFDVLIIIDFNIIFSHLVSQVIF
jgi:hypothetical protein